MSTDVLSPLLRHFSVNASTFFTGNLCERVGFSSSRVAYLHILHGGSAALCERSGEPLYLEPQTLVFYSRPAAHWIRPDSSTGADLACASVSFEHAEFNPIVHALPVRTVRSLSEFSTIEPVLRALFLEASSSRSGQQEVLDRLFEVVLIELLRISIASGSTETGLLRGLAHPQLRRLMTAVHEDPAGPWSLDRMAKVAHMSRSSFAVTFKRELGMTPGEYLGRWRVSVAQALIREGVQLMTAGERAGYESHAGFLRAFKQIVGMTPSQWKERQKQPSMAATEAAP